MSRIQVPAGSCLSAGTVAAAVLVAVSAGGCATYRQTCTTTVVSRSSYPTGVSSNPTLPRMVGRPLRDGEWRLALEADYFPFAGDSTAAGDSSAEMTPNWFSTSNIGANWQTALSDMVGFGLYMDFGGWTDLASARGNGSAAAPEVVSGHFAMGTALKVNFMPEDSPVSLSVIGELGVRSEQSVWREVQHVVESCEYDCYGSGWSLYGPSRVSHGSGSGQRSWDDIRELSSGDTVADASVSLQVAVPVDRGVSVLAIVTLEPRSIDEMIEEGGPNNKGWFKDPDGTHEWRTFPLLNLGGGVDISGEGTFIDVLLFFPMELEQRLDYGPGLMVLAGIEQ